MPEVGVVAGFEQAFFSVVQRAILPLVKQLASLEDEFQGLRLALEQSKGLELNTGSHAKAREENKLPDPEKTPTQQSVTASPTHRLLTETPAAPIEACLQERSADLASTEKPFASVSVVVATSPASSPRASPRTSPREVDLSADALGGKPEPAKQSEAAWWQPRQQPPQQQLQQQKQQKPEQHGQPQDTDQDSLSIAAATTAAQAAAVVAAMQAATPLNLSPRRDSDRSVVRARPDEERSIQQAIRRNSKDRKPAISAPMEVFAHGAESQEQRQCHPQTSSVGDIRQHPGSFAAPAPGSFAASAAPVTIAATALSQRHEALASHPPTPVVPSGRIMMVAPGTSTPTVASHIAGSMSPGVMTQFGSSYPSSGPAASPSPRSSRNTVASASMPQFATGFGRISPRKSHSPVPQRPPPSTHLQWAAQPQQLSDPMAIPLQWRPPKVIAPSLSHSPPVQPVEQSANPQMIWRPRDQAHGPTLHPEKENDFQASQQVGEQQASLPNELPAHTQPESEAEVQSPVTQDENKIPAGVPIMERCSSARRPASVNRRDR